MQSFEVIGRWLIFLGLGLVVVGGIFWLMGRLPALQNLPGTIKIEREGFTCVFPLAASILLSILLTVILNIIARLGSR
ncbi:MAG: DUF2905 domain-containing protein [Chloroflexota bacterium]|nr:MAG: hypothetical protein KatS3mg045_0892 [Bellilinea sp.]